MCYRQLYEAGNLNVGGIPGMYLIIQINDEELVFYIYFNIIKSFWDDVGLIMKASVQWYTVAMSWIPPLTGFKLITSWSEVRRANHLVAWLPQIFRLTSLNKLCRPRSISQNVASDKPTLFARVIQPSLRYVYITGSKTDIKISGQVW